MGLEAILDWADRHPLGSLLLLAAMAAAIVVWAATAPVHLPQEPDEFGTGDLGAAAREFVRVPEGGLRRPGDPGPRRIGDAVDPASGLPRPV